MSGIGSDPDEYAPGNQPDGVFYNLFPESPQPGLLGGQSEPLLWPGRRAHASRCATPHG